MHVRLSAWLNAAPETKEGGDGGKRRIEYLADRGVEPDMPECVASYLVAYLYEIGPTCGEGPIEWPHIEAWCNRIGIDLNAWESSMIRRLSRDHMRTSHEARKLECACPWESAPYAEVDQYIKSMRAKASLRKAAEA